MILTVLISGRVSVVADVQCGTVTVSAMGATWTATRGGISWEGKRSPTKTDQLIHIICARFYGAFAFVSVLLGVICHVYESVQRWCSTHVDH